MDLDEVIYDSQELEETITCDFLQDTQSFSGGTGTNDGPLTVSAVGNMSVQRQNQPGKYPKWLLACVRNILKWAEIQSKKVKQSQTRLMKLTESTDDASHEHLKVNLADSMLRDIDSGLYPRSKELLSNLKQTLKLEAVSNQTTHLEKLQKSISKEALSRKLTEEVEQFIMKTQGTVSQDVLQNYRRMCEELSESLTQRLLDQLLNKAVSEEQKKVRILNVSQRPTLLNLSNSLFIVERRDEGCTKEKTPKVISNGDRPRETFDCDPASTFYSIPREQENQRKEKRTNGREKTKKGEKIVANSNNITGFQIDIFNLSKKDIPKGIHNILKKGEKFITGPKDISLMEQVELFHKITQDVLLKADPQRKITNPKRTEVITNAFVKKLVSEAKRPKIKNDSYHNIQTVTSWLLDNKLLLKSADKNLGLVIMDVAHYKNEVMMHLQNENSYEKISRDIGIPKVIIIQDINYRLLKDLKAIFGKHRIMGSNLANKVIKQMEGLNQTSIPKFKVMPKIHKIPMKTRPIIPAFSSHTTPISQYCDSILQPVLKLFNWVVDGSLDVLHRFENLNINLKDPILMSADVSSLYTSIDLESGIRKVKALLLAPPVSWNHDKTDLIIDLITWVFKNNYFEFDDKIYRQKNGIAMGTSVAPTFANLVLIHCEFLKMHKKGLMPKGYMRFVDDTWMVIEREDIEKYNLIFQELDKFLDWTFVYGKTVPFLDFKVSLDEKYTTYNKVDLTVYEKESNLHLYTDPNSDYPHHYRYGWIKSETQRLLRNSTSEDSFYTSRDEFRFHLLRANYKAAIIDPLLNINYARRVEFLSKIKNDHDPSKRRIVSTIPHVENYKAIKNTTQAWFSTIKTIYPKLDNVELLAPVLKGTQIIHMGNKTNELTLRKSS